VTPRAIIYLRPQQAVDVHFSLGWQLADVKEEGWTR